MDVNEAVALIRLYQACGDPEVRALAVRLVPELLELGPALVVDNDKPRAVRYLVKAFSANLPITEVEVVSSEVDLKSHLDALRDQLPLANNLTFQCINLDDRG
jgi:hypothetical protein